jgi:hypothetical protein
MGGPEYFLIAAFSATYILVPLAALATALCFLITVLRDWRRWRLPLALSIAFVGASVTADHLVLNVHTVRTYQMQFSLHGREEWAPGLRLPQGHVLIYRSVGDGYCYDELESQELHDHLASKPHNTVTVEYEIISDFGRVRGYNVLTVDGINVKGGNRGGGSGFKGSGTSPSCF